jgi:putative methyltransferase (TIGR04325 family)
MSLKSLIKELTPPLILKGISNMFYGWSGNYSTWREAQKKCTGYDSQNIIDKVKDSLLKVKNGEAVFERDSVIFDKVHYSYPLLSALSQVALAKGSLNVLDFGGSLGSSYYQNRALFNQINDFTWSIIEQEHFVTEGKKTFSDDKLSFYYTIDECFKERKIDVLLLSSVLQYIEKPYEFIEGLILENFDYIIIDRTPMLSEGNDRITIQTVPKNIYEAKYPCWLLNENKVLDKLLVNYELLADEVTNENINISNAAYRFFFLKKKK